MPNILEEETRGREEVKPTRLSPFRLLPFMFQTRVDGEVKVYEEFHEEGQEEKKGRRKRHKYRVDIIF